MDDRKEDLPILLHQFNIGTLKMNLSATKTKPITTCRSPLESKLKRTILSYTPENEVRASWNGNIRAQRC